MLIDGKKAYEGGGGGAGVIEWELGEAQKFIGTGNQNMVEQMGKTLQGTYYLDMESSKGGRVIGKHLRETGQRDGRGIEKYMEESIKIDIMMVKRNQYQ